jgi:hypothetical protein
MTQNLMSVKAEGVGSVKFHLHKLKKLKLMKVLRNVQRVGNRKRKEGMQ